MDRYDHYQSQDAVLQAQWQQLRRQGRACFVGALLTFLLFVLFLVLYTTVGGGAVTLGLAAVSLVCYLYVRRLDVANDRRIGRVEDLRSVYRREMQACRGDYSTFDRGDRYVCQHHAFTYDLDIFGPDSLFQRISRCVTTCGADRLAERLSLARVDNQADAIEALSHEEAWRAGWMAYGQRGRIDVGRIRTAVSAARGRHLPLSSATRLLCGVGYVMMAGFYLAIVLACTGMVDAQLPLWWGIFQFFAVYTLCTRAVRTISKSVAGLHAPMGILVQAVAHIRTLSAVPDGLKDRFGELEEAILSFRQLDDVLQRLDRRGNYLGLLLMDTFFLSDFFLVRRFVRWQQAYVDKIDRWIDHVAELDALVSMATYRYNHPATTYARVVDAEGVVYRAKALAHPFLGDKAVPNDFAIADGHYYIVTGANMAGKSTFLRALGVNYVMALSGMPVSAEEMEVSRFRLFSSMRTTDDLSHGISYFNAELRRLHQLIEAVRAGGEQAPGSGKHTLIILDEILRGTNSLDKLNGSRLFLDYISRFPVSGVIATHDLELSKMQGERFHNFCFEIELGDPILYSYKITPGVATNQNATYLLQQMLGQE